MQECMEKTVEFSKVWLANGDVRACMDQQIKEFMGR
jgi:CDP-glucose 4,6-dehydratase